MNSQLRALLMSADYNASGTGFHRLAFKVDLGRNRRMGVITVMISVDAERKLAAQLTRARMRRVERDRLLLAWARWEIDMRLRDKGALPATLTITASDLDDLGAYAHGFGRTLTAS